MQFDVKFVIYLKLILKTCKLIFKIEFDRQRARKAASQFFNLVACTQDSIVTFFFLRLRVYCWDSNVVQPKLFRAQRTELKRCEHCWQSNGWDFCKSNNKASFSNKNTVFHGPPMKNFCRTSRCGHG